MLPDPIDTYANICPCSYVVPYDRYHNTLLRYYIATAGLGCNVIGVGLVVLLLVGLVFLLNDPQDVVAEFRKQRSSQRLGEELAKHLFGWTIVDFQLIALYSVGNKEVSDMDVSGPLAARCLPIVSELDTRFVILIKNVAFAHDVTIDSHSLFGEEVLNPHIEQHTVTDGHQFSFSRTGGISFCFVDIAIIAPDPNPRVKTPPVCDFCHCELQMKHPRSNRNCRSHPIL